MSASHVVKNETRGLGVDVSHSRWDRNSSAVRLQRGSCTRQHFSSVIERVATGRIIKSKAWIRDARMVAALHAETDVWSLMLWQGPDAKLSIVVLV